MKVDHVLILAAGKGTRMGCIGKVLPKVIWPVFDKSLLELQVAYAKRLAPKAMIHINLFHYKEVISSHLKKKAKSFENVNIIYENSALDVGGAVHNMAAQVGYTGNLLILNSDQFLFVSDKLIKKGLERLREGDSLLFSYEVNSDDLYNALSVSEQGLLESIVLNDKLLRNQSILTYSGMSLIKLSSLDRCEGKSRFFDTVCDFRSKKVVVKAVKDFEYWDFGTLKRYHESIYELLDRCQGDFLDFLTKQKALSLEAHKAFKCLDKITYSDFEVSKKSIKYLNFTESF